jgi:hypothetical protein
MFDQIELLTNPRHGGLRVAHDQLRGDPHDLEATPSERTVPPRVSEQRHVS